MYRAEPHDLALRLGLNVPREQWPTGRALAELVGAGFRWVQFHAPPRAVLQDPAALRVHGRALRALLDPTGLRLVLHAPDDLSAGTPGADRAVTGLLEYAAEAGAELVAYHGLNFPDDHGPHAETIRERALLEERSLAQHLQRAHTLGITVAIENLAPVFPGAPRMCHDPIAVRDLVRRLASPAAGMLLDLGHLHVTCDIAGTDPAALAAACARDVVLFHVHDNVGARSDPVSCAGHRPAAARPPPRARGGLAAVGQDRRHGVGPRRAAAARGPAPASPGARRPAGRDRRIADPGVGRPDGGVSR